MGESMKLLKIYFPLLTSFFYSFVCYSQSDTTQADYKHAIQFYVIDEIIAAYKYNFAENSAFRFVINATGLYNDKDSDEIEYREQISDTVTFYENYQTIRSNQYFEVKCQYLFFIDFNEIVKSYIGAGPFISYQFNQDESWRESFYSNSQDIHKGYWRMNENIWSVGFSAVIGLECKVFDNICLFTEYEGFVSRGWQTNDWFASNSTFNTNEYDIEIWTYELKGLRIGLGIYF